MLKTLSSLTRTQNAIRASLELALVDLWRSEEMSIVKLGRLERIEYHAMSAAYDLWRE